jgi:hypothetical protein
MKIQQALSIFSTMILLGLIMSQVADSEEGNQADRAVRPEIVAGFIHAVIESDRTVYTRHVVDRMQETGAVIASESWESRNTLPLPAQMLLLSGTRVKEKGMGLEYRLASLLPIYQKNGPATDFEKIGLEAVERDPSQPYTGFMTPGEKGNIFRQSMPTCSAPSGIANSVKSWEESLFPSRWIKKKETNNNRCTQL